MRAVIIALSPAALFGVYLYGWPAANLIVLSVVAAMLAEAACTALAGRAVRATLADGSAVLTGLILALCLPPWAPWWIAVTGAAFAIVVGKQVFGGLGQNVLNPAMLARVALLLSFPVEMTAWVTPQPWPAAGAPGFSAGLAITFGAMPVPDALTSATALAPLRGADGGVSEPGSVVALALGMVPGSLGETSALLLLAGGLWLTARRIVPWQIPFAMLATLALLASGFHLADAQRFASPLVHVMAGSAIFCAFFIATDPVGAPVTATGRLIFGAGVGALVFAIRSWGGYPEGVAFAVLLMNAATPLIDRYVRPRRYGRTRSGAPLAVGAATSEKRDG
jgi:electron transport complex protein RnfD